MFLYVLLFCFIMFSLIHFLESMGIALRNEKDHLFNYLVDAIRIFKHNSKLLNSTYLLLKVLTFILPRNACIYII